MDHRKHMTSPGAPGCTEASLPATAAASTRRERSSFIVSSKRDSQREEEEGVLASAPGVEA